MTKRVTNLGNLTSEVKSHDSTAKTVNEKQVKL